jgi:uncharacterized protein
MRIFFATDIHGSEICFKKFLKAYEFYNVDALFLGGDYTSKALLMCVKLKDKWLVELDGENIIQLDTRKEFENFRKTYLNSGHLVKELSEEEYRLAQEDEGVKTKIFNMALRDTLKSWTDLAHSELKNKNISIYTIPGNDEPIFCDEFFTEPPFIPLNGQHLKINNEISVLGIGGSNKTPWSTWREYSEEQINQFIESSLSDKLKNLPTIFFIHTPPFQSGLDDAPAINKDFSLKLSLGSADKQAVGSKSVRNAIDQHQPLLGLFGHVHESRGYMHIGDTLCINPGSSYFNGVLQGCVIEIEKNQIKSFQLTEG